MADRRAAAVKADARDARLGQTKPPTSQPKFVSRGAGYLALLAVHATKRDREGAEQGRRANAA